MPPLIECMRTSVLADTAGMREPPACQPLRAPFDTQLWLIDLRQPDTGHEQVLSVHEQARAARFRFERDARRYRVSHLALRHLLASALGCLPSAVVMESGPHGKPHLRGSGYHFNLSHSDDWALIALHPHHPIGVDLECGHPISDWATLAQQNYTPSENEALRALPADEQALGFLRCWTRKEACLKALGSGLLIEPNGFEAGIHPAAARVGVAVPQGGICQMNVVSLDVSAQIGQQPPPLLLGALALVESQAAGLCF